MDDKVKEIQRGWVQYFRLADNRWKLKDLDGWVRSRTRYCIWHFWKIPKCRCKSLIRLGIDPVRARQWSHTRRAGCQKFDFSIFYFRSKRFWRLNVPLGTKYR